MVIKILKADAEDIILGTDRHIFDCGMCDNCHANNQEECASPYVHNLVEIGDVQLSMWMQDNGQWLSCPTFYGSSDYRTLLAITRRYGIKIEVEC